MYNNIDNTFRTDDLATLVALVRTIKRFEILGAEVNPLLTLQRLKTLAGKQIACYLLRGEDFNTTEEVREKAWAIRILALGPRAT